MENIFNTVKWQLYKYCQIGNIMIKKYILRLMFVLGLLSLAACETTTPSQKIENNSQGATTTSHAIDDKTSSVDNQQVVTHDGADNANSANNTDASADSADIAQNQGALFAILLADVNSHAGWNQVDIGNGMLYFHPEPMLDRDDFQGVSATENDGVGMVVLEMTTEGQKHLLEKTADNPDMMLAFIIDTTLLSMVGYSEPVDSDFLAFSAGNPENAVAVAQAIAGVSDTTDTDKD